MRPAISFVIPHWPMAPEHDALLERCVASLPSDPALPIELLVVVNDGIGVPKAANRGFRLARGEWIVFWSNDLEWRAGELGSLCARDAIVSPRINGEAQPTGRIWGCGFSMPRWAYEQLGPLDERFFPGYCADDDYIARATELGIPMRAAEAIDVFHGHGAATVRLMPDSAGMQARAAEAFREKWGREP